MSEIAPHNLTSNISAAPDYLVIRSDCFSTLDAWMLFDNTPSSPWIFSGSTGWFILHCIGKKCLPTQYQIYFEGAGATNRGPSNFTFQGSNDGTTWDTLDTQTGQTWTSGQTRSYSLSTSTHYTSFKLNITANNGDSFTQLSEFFIQGTPDTVPSDYAPHDLTSQTSHSPYVTSSSSEFNSGSRAFFCYDGLFNSNAASWIGTGSGVDWIKIDLGTGVANTILAYSFSCINTNRAPKTWTLEGSNDDSTWTTVDTRTNITGWKPGTYAPVSGSDFEIRTFFLSSESAGYRYFRVNITANNGDATYTQITEIYLFGTPGSSSTPVTESVSDTLSLSDSIIVGTTAANSYLLSDTLVLSDSIGTQQSSTGTGGGASAFGFVY